MVMYTLLVHFGSLAVNCGAPPVPRNGSSHGTETTFPNAFTFSCDLGFLLNGSSLRICQANRTWSGEDTTCDGMSLGYGQTDGHMSGCKRLSTQEVN